jgi:hypothetical protein
VGAYRRHVELTDEELERLEAVMYLRPRCLGCFSYRRELVNSRQPSQEVSGFANREHIGAIAAETRAA